MGVILGLLVLLPACTDNVSPAQTKAQAIIDRARETHGVEVLDSATVMFDFRGKHFSARHDARGFRYTRTYIDSTGARIRETFTPDSLYRTVDGQRVSLSEEERWDLEEVLNSVVYFTLLPEALADPAVQPRYLGMDTLDGEAYHEIEVTFRKEGGGRDWQDRFVYWVHQHRHTMDYLAYYYHTEGGGSRFRKAVNPRTVGGVRFQDYLNYKAAPDTLGLGAIEHYDELMRSGALELISEVRLDSVRVQPLP